MKTSATPLRKRSTRPYEQIVIEGVTPAIEQGRFPVKAIVGENCAVEATVFRHGHERLSAAVRIRRPGTAEVREVPMVLVDPARDRWHAEFLLDAPGRFTLTIAAWTDRAGRGAPRSDEVRYESDIEVMADRPLARTGAWIHLSERAGLEARLAELHDWGFDVVHVGDINPIDLAGATDEESFKSVVLSANSLGLEVALGIESTCRPGHAWLTEHPEWFHKRADSSSPASLNFETSDWKRLWHATREVVRFWIARGVRIFTVESPDSRPMGFWSWLIEEVHLESPEVIFVAGEAPRMPIARALGARGFAQTRFAVGSQSARADLMSLVSDMRSPAIRPNFVVDAIATGHPESGCAAWQSRFVLGATLAPAFTVNDPPPGAGELMRRINSARKTSVALQHSGSLVFGETDDDAVVAYVRSTPNHSDSVIAIVNLDPRVARSANVRIPDGAVGVAAGESFAVEDAMTGQTFTWSGSFHVSLDPKPGPAASVLMVRGR